MEFMWVILALVIGSSISLAMKSNGTRTYIGTFQIYKFVSNGKVNYNLEKCTDNNIKGEVNIPDDITCIANSCFKNCTLMTEVKFNRVVNIIGNNSFDGCISITEINLPNSTKILNEYCFKDCLNLKRIYFGDNVSNIEAFAFSGCLNIEEITMLSYIPALLHDTSFEDNIKNKVVLYVPKGSLNSYLTAPSWRQFTNIKEL